MVLKRKEEREGQGQLELGVGSQLIMLIDSAFKTNVKGLLRILAEDCDPRYGFNYELGSKVKQYYSNVHATVMINLFLSNLLPRSELLVMQDALLRLRDDNPSVVYNKTNEDKYAWDVIEGPSAFSTALSCYALLLTQDARLPQVGRSIDWLLRQRNDQGIWPVFKRGGTNNYVTTLYSTLALRAWTSANPDARLARDIASTLQDVSEFLKRAFILSNGNYFVNRYRENRPCLANTIVCLHLLKILDAASYLEVLDGATRSIDDMVLDSEDWYISELSDIREDDRTKRMYTYNPAFLPILLRLGWNVEDRAVLRMLYWTVSDLRSFWLREGRIYPWRSSDSVIESFICSLSIYTLTAWVKRFVLAKTQYIEANLVATIAGKDVFLCYATEDRKQFVHPLHEGLVESGISVWYDQGQIQWGNSITRRIEDGIKKSRFAVICFSENFLKKNWANSEFDALYQRQQREGGKLLLPLILNSKGQVLDTYPRIRDISHEEWSTGIGGLVKEIKTLLRRPGGC